MNASREFVARHIAKRTGTTQRQALESLEAVLETIQELAAQGYSVQLRGFGTLAYRKYKGRDYYSPLYKSSYGIPERYVFCLKPSGKVSPLPAELFKKEDR